MRNWFRRRRDAREASRATEAQPDLADSPWVRAQTVYWTFDAAEKEALLARHRDNGLDWPGTLRLHHLACLELLDTPPGRAVLEDPDADPTDADQADVGETARLCRELAERLAGAASPYAPLDAVVWQGALLAHPDERPPDRFGTLSNASLTHLGSLEVIRVGESGAPTEVAFIPFADIVSLRFLAPPSLFRAAVLATDGGNDTVNAEVVAVPLLYATAWRPEAGEHDRDGTLTRFCFTVPVPGAGRMPLGIGVGHQDLLMDARDSGGPSLMGMASVAAFAATEPAEP